MTNSIPEKSLFKQFASKLFSINENNAKPLKVLIFGKAKSGTTILTYRIAESLGKSCQIIFEPKERNIEDEKSHRIFTKCLLGNYNNPDILSSIYSDYDKKIWIARDPRDVIISSFLYSWYKGHEPDQNCFKKL